MMRRILAIVTASGLLAGSAWAVGLPYIGSVPNEPFLFWSGLPAPAGSLAPIPGQALSLTIPDTNWTTISDQGAAPFVNGWTGDLLLKGMNVQTNTTSQYNCTNAAGCPNFTNPKLTVTLTSPGFNSSGAATTVSRTIDATGWLRQTYANQANPTEVQSGSDASVAFSFSDFVYADDTSPQATLLAGLYTSIAGTYVGANLATNNITVTNNSTKTYPAPICTWVTEPGLRYDGSANATVEIFCGHGYGQGGVPVAAVKITMGDGTHSVTKTVSSLTASTRQYSTSCTATNGSNVLQNCGDVKGFKVGQRLNVPGVPGQALIGAIDTSNGGNCSTSPCLELYNQETATPTAAGALTLSTAPNSDSAAAKGTAWADGGFAGQTITEITSNCTGSTKCLNVNPATIVVPTGTGSTSGSSTSLTAGAPSQGQWAANMWITGTNIPLNDYAGSITGGGGAGTITLHTASTGTVSGTITGMAIAANPGAATVASVVVSTSATGCNAGCTAGTYQFNENYLGTTGSVTVTAGSPVPVYAATFTPTDFSSLTSNGPIYFRAIAYPVIGDVTLDSDAPYTTYSSVVAGKAYTPNIPINNANCDWWYFNVAGTGGFGVCDSGNAAWFPQVANVGTTGQALSNNFHDLWAYYDLPGASGSYGPLYVFVEPVAGTAASNAAIYSSATDPGGNANHFASVFAALAFAKACNGNNAGCTNSGGASTRASAHGSDINGIVFCIIGNVSAGPGGLISAQTTAWKPGITITGAPVGGACPGPNGDGTFKKFAASTVTWAGGAANDRIPDNSPAHINNLTMNGSNTLVQGADTATTTRIAFLLTEAVLENDIITGAATNQIKGIGGLYYYNDVLNEEASTGSFLGGAAPQTLNMSMGDTLICGTGYASNNDAWAVMNALGDMTFGCAPYLGATYPTTANGTIPLTQVFAYNRVMGMFNIAQYIGNANVYQSVTGALLINNVVETTYNSQNNHSFWWGADGTSSPINNVVEYYNTSVGQRGQQDYAEGQPLTGTKQASPAGSLGVQTWFMQITYAKTGAPGTPVSTDATASVAQGVSISGAGSSIVVNAPCDPNYVAYYYLDGTNNPPQHYGIDAIMTGGTGGVPSTTLAITAVSQGTLYVGSTVEDNTAGSSTGVQVTACPAGGCGVTGNYTLSGNATITAGHTIWGQATQIAMCQAVALVQVDGLTNNPIQESASIPAKSYVKTNVFDRFNNFANMNFKDDLYTSGIANGGRVGNWERRYGVAAIGDVYVTGPATGSGFAPSSQWGEVIPYNTVGNSATPIFADQSYVVHKVGDNRSVANGTGANAAPFYPGLNIGEGDYCPTNTSQTASRVPAGLSAWPWDIQGNSRLNNGSGYAGAYESGCW